MTPSRLDAWILDLIDQVARGQRVEDALVELKSAWIDHAHAARRLAGHCNAARGEPILWLFGVDEKRGLTGIEVPERAAWRDGVAQYFHGAPPTMLLDRVLHVDGKAVVGLLFGTDAAPYVVHCYDKSRGSKSLENLEVPYREATAVRSATRHDLLRILVPAAAMPELESLQGTIEFRDDFLDWTMQLYVHADLGQGLVFPMHMMKASLSIGTTEDEMDVLAVKAAPLRRHINPVNPPVFPQDDRESKTIDATLSEVLVHGPGVLSVGGRARAVSSEKLTTADRLSSRLVLACRKLPRPLVLEEQYTQTEPAKWQSVSRKVTYMKWVR